MNQTSKVVVTLSKFTTEVRFICETASSLTESAGFDSIEDIITSAAPNVFNFPFPIFDETYRLPLERKILRHYYTREICEETVGLWKLRLSDRLNMIMPYYNKLYESATLEFNPFYDVNLTREHTTESENNESRRQVTDTDTTNTSTNTGESETTGTTSNTSSNTSANTNWDLYSDTPQGGIDGIERAGSDVTGNAYLTNARKVTDNGSNATTESGSSTSTQETTVTDTANGTVDSTVTGTAEITSTEDYVEHVTGKQGSTSYSKMLMEFRETLLNIDKMVIDELQDLFFGLWA